MRIQVEGVLVRCLRLGIHLSDVLCSEARTYRIFSTRPATGWDDSWAVIVAVPHEARFNACTEGSCAQRYVFKVIDDALSERVMAILNGGILCAQVITEDESHCIPSILSAEELHEYPVVSYSEADFGKETVCKPKTANSGIMQRSAA